MTVLSAFVSIQKSEIGRKSSGITSIRNTGTEAQMREELAKAVGGVIANMSTDNVELTEDEIKKLLDVADIVTMARTAVEHDYRGDVIDAHAPEMPTRFAKQLTQIIRGGIAIGMSQKSHGISNSLCAGFRSTFTIEHSVGYCSPSGITSGRCTTTDQQTMDNCQA